MSINLQRIVLATIMIIIHTTIKRIMASNGVMDIEQAFRKRNTYNRNSISNTEQMNRHNSNNNRTSHPSYTRSNTNRNNNAGGNRAITNVTEVLQQQ